MRHRDAEETLALARRIRQGPLRYRGIMGYEGHAVLVPDKEKRERIAREALTELSRHVEALRSAGFAPEIVSAGGTGTYDITGSWPDVTEVQAGSYVFMDGAYRIVRPDLGRPALTLLTDCDFAPRRSCDHRCGDEIAHQRIWRAAGKDLPIKVIGLSEEHGHLDASGTEIDAGMKIEIIPSHNDTTINLHSEYYVMRGDEVRCDLAD